MSPLRVEKFFRNETSEKTSASTISTYDMEKELERRQLKNVFPLHVFHPKIRPFITMLHQYYDLPASFIGLSMLTAYSTAVGTSYAIVQGNNHSYLPVWGCLEGISSSGKSLAIDMVLDPLYKIQDEFDKQYIEERRDEEWTKEKSSIDTIIFRDVHIATLTRYVMPDNAKGALKISDEIMEWINGMNQLSRKEGTDEQFWLSAWNARNYSGIRAGKDKFVLPRVFVNIVGGIQPTITWKLFSKDRDTTGFIFRLLFAVPETVKIAQPDSSFIIPDEILQIHSKSLLDMYHGLQVNDAHAPPKQLLFSRPALLLYEGWRRTRIVKINKMREIRAKDIHSGILGKISEYAKRFAALLHIANLSYDNLFFGNSELINEQTMTDALELADYFYESAVVVYERVNDSIVAPPDVLRFAAYVHAGMSYHKIGKMEWPMLKDDSAKKRAARTIKKMINKYPRVFRASEK